MFRATDDDLIKQIAVGNEYAFVKLFDRYAGIVLGYCTRLLGDKIKAEDIAQEVWMKVLKSAINYQPQNKPQAWILTIARNTTWDFLRQQKHILINETADEITPDTTHIDIEILIEKKQNLELVKSVVDELPETQRLVFVTWMTEKKSHTELAREFNTSVSAIKSLIFRARQSLTKKFDEAANG